MVKILMTWDIKPGREQEYFEFMVREWVPGIQRLGIEPTDAWYTQHGNSPQILSGGTARSFRAARRATSMPCVRYWPQTIGPV